MIAGALLVISPPFLPRLHAIAVGADGLVLRLVRETAEEADRTAEVHRMVNGHLPTVSSRPSGRCCSV